MKYKTEKKELVYFAGRLYKRHYTTATGGNISIRIADDLVLITPSQKDKGRLTINHIGKTNAAGENLTPHIRLSMETMMHVMIYNRRPDIKAIIHAHPPVATAYMATSHSINTHLTGEVFAIAGEPAYVPYLLMGSVALAEKVAEASLLSNVILMKNHGVTTLGNTLTQAFSRLEAIENAALINFYVHMLGKPEEIGHDECKKILDLIQK